MPKHLNGHVSERPSAGRMIFLTRDSGGRHEMTPGQYIERAQQAANTLGPKFSGKAEQLNKMIEQRRFADGDLFQDQDISGNKLERPGLNAAFREIERDRTISHLFIPRADRLARPDHIQEGLALEFRIRHDLGVSIIYFDRTLPAVPRGQTVDLSEYILSAIGFHKAERDRHELAQKTLDSQRALATQGYSTGGRAKYGLCRVLVNQSGKLIRQLEDGESIRTKGQHVRWVPDDSERWQVRCRIVRDLFVKPASRIARELTLEQVPSPDAGRTRRERNGAKHSVSGTWNQSTIIKIGRDPINIGIAEYGARSMGDKLRFGVDGPRPLGESDFRSDNQPKVIFTPLSDRVRTPVDIEHLLTRAEFDELQAILNRRAGTQRGKPRSQDPERNPLGTRIFDMACSWPMYRGPHKDGFRYTCGQYLQSCGAKCQHNHVDGPATVAFVLKCIQQKLILTADFRRKLEKRFKAMALRDSSSQRSDEKIVLLREKLSETNGQLAVVAKNMALAPTSAQRDSTAIVFDELDANRLQLEKQLKIAEQSSGLLSDPEAEIAAALEKADRLQSLASDSSNFGAIGSEFELLNVRLFLNFREASFGKRLVRKPAGGILVFGAERNPIDIYQGPTKRLASTRGIPSSATDSDHGSILAGTEGDSLRNVNRGRQDSNLRLINPPAKNDNNGQ